MSTSSEPHHLNVPNAWTLAVAWVCIVIGAVCFAMLVASLIRRR